MQFVTVRLTCMLYGTALTELFKDMEQKVKLAMLVLAYIIVLE